MGALLLLFLHLLEPLLEGRLLFRLGFFRLDLLPNLVLVDQQFFDGIHLAYADDIRHEVVQAQARREPIEEKQHHERENLLDDLHVGHARLLRLRRLIRHRQSHVNESRCGHQNGESADVRPVKWNAERQVEDAVVCAQIIRPQKRLAAQCDVRWEKPEHGVQDGHLKQGGEATGERIDPRVSVEPHGGLLPGHGVVFVLLVDGLNLWPQDAHFRGAQEIFPGNRGERQFDDQGDDQDDEANRGNASGKPIVKRQNHVPIHPTKNPPAIINHPADLCHSRAFKERQVVGAEIPAQGSAL